MMADLFGRNIQFMQSKISGRKNASYYGFLKAIGEENLQAFDER